MGLLNLLKANWTGKVGQTVGAKWKNKSTIRVFTPPSNPNTPLQQEVRTAFGEINAFVALFADQLRTLTALDTKAMSVRNAIVSLNDDMIGPSQSFAPENLRISRGGLPSPQFNAVTSGQNIELHWTPITGPTISQRATVVFVAVAEDGSWAGVTSALNEADTAMLTRPDASMPCHGYAYMIDWRGSTRVGSPSWYNLYTT